MHKLPDVPSALRRPHFEFGTYRGEAPWHIRVGRMASLMREKKWQWFCAFDDEVAIGGAIVSAGYAGKTFVWVFDRASQTMLVDESKTLLPFQVAVANDASHREIAEARGMWSIEREGVQWRAVGTLGSIAFEISIDERDRTPMTAVCPTTEGRFNVTRKSVSASASGSIRVGSKRFELDGHALLDHSHGLMDRQTSWLWAIGSGERYGFNFIDGFNDGLESVVWTPEGIRHVPEISIDPSTWTVTDPSGDVRLELEVEGVRSEDVNLGLVTSRYTQPLGIWHGELFGEEIEAFGVAEDHLAKW